MNTYLRLITKMIPVMMIASIWGQETKPLALEDCIKLGLEHNQSLRINRFETDRSISQAKSNLAIVLPRVDLSLSGSLNGNFPALMDTALIPLGSTFLEIPSPTGEYGDLDWNDRYNLSVNLSQNLWDGGRWWNTLKVAREAQDLADIQFSAFELGTIYQVKVAFYNYLSSKKILDVYHENLNTSEYQHQLTLERYKLGAASPNDTLRTRVSIERSRLQIINGEVELAKRAQELNVILGREWNSPLTLIEPLWDPVVIPKIDQAIAEAMTASPNIQSLQRNEKIAGYNVKIAKSDYIPSLGLTASYGNFSQATGDLLTKDNTSFSTGIKLSWNIMNGFRTKRNVEQSKINARLATENLDLAQRNLRKDLAQIIDQMRSLEESVEISVLIQEASTQDLLLAQEQYKIGSLSILDVLTILASYEDAKSNLIRTRYSLKIAEAGLHQLMGKY